MAEQIVDVPLFVDLDGTLIKSDVSYEAFVGLIKLNPLYIFAALIWYLKGKAYFKDRIAELVNLDAELFPYNERFLEFLRAEKEKGRKLILASASHVKYVSAAAEKVGIFDDVIASDASGNRSGKDKLAAIKNWCRDNNFEHFAYAGNEARDLVIWRDDAAPVLVCDSKGFAARACREINFSEKFIHGNRFSALWHSLRPHQWSKNLLLLVPLVLAHKIFEPGVALNAALGFLAFCLCSSATYLLNDLIDLESDRRHRTKKFRPLASGGLQIKAAVAAVPVLLASAAGISIFLPAEFGAYLALYTLTTLVYSLIIKRIAIIDVVVLSMLYVLRLFAGGVVTEVPVSQWLISFSLFTFTSLACLKRFSELRQMKKEDGAIHGRGYKAGDLEAIAQFGSCSAYLAVFVIVFYINSKEVVALYSNAHILWFLCPLIMYWFMRIWIMAHRGRVHEDPVVFALRDRVSYLVAALTAVLLIMAT